MEGNSDVINAAVDFVMNRKEEILKMGYLVKSPAKSKDKANYAMFWKVRWCVLVKAIFADPLLNAEYSNYLLYYYEDEEHYKQASLPKGELNSLLYAILNSIIMHGDCTLGHFSFDFCSNYMNSFRSVNHDIILRHRINCHCLSVSIFERR